MTIEEIRKGTPDGATMYSDKVIHYFKYHRITNWLQVWAYGEWCVVGQLTGLGELKPLHGE